MFLFSDWNITGGQLAPFCLGWSLRVLSLVRIPLKALAVGKTNSDKAALVTVDKV